MASGAEWRDALSALCGERELSPYDDSLWGRLLELAAVHWPRSEVRSSHPPPPRPSPVPDVDSPHQPPFRRRRPNSSHGWRGRGGGVAWGWWYGNSPTCWNGCSNAIPSSPQATRRPPPPLPGPFRGCSWWGPAGSICTRRCPRPTPWRCSRPMRRLRQRCSSLTTAISASTTRGAARGQTPGPTLAPATSARAPHHSVRAADTNPLAPPRHRRQPPPRPQRPALAHSSINSRSRRRRSRLGCPAER